MELEMIVRNVVKNTEKDVRKKEENIIKNIIGSMNIGSIWLFPTNTETLADWHRKKCGDECDKNSNM